jgi:hypothetical protein
MDQQVPFPDEKRVLIGLIVAISAPIKYFKHDVVRENTDRCLVSLPFIWAHRVSIHYNCNGNVRGRTLRT